MKKIILENCSACVAGFNNNIDILIDSKNSYIVNRSEYHNDGKFSGVPLYIGERCLFDLLRGSNRLSDIVSGVVDWDCRKAWLDCFSIEQINNALLIEKMFSNTNGLFTISFSLKKLTSTNIAAIWETVQNCGTIYLIGDCIKLDINDSQLLEKLSRMKQEFENSKKIKSC